MIYGLETGIPTLEGVIRSIGMDKNSLTMTNLPPEMGSAFIGRAAKVDYRRLLRFPHSLTSASVREVIVMSDHTGRFLPYKMPFPEGLSPHRPIRAYEAREFSIIGTINPGLNEGGFTVDVLGEMISNPEIRVAIQGSSYGCSVLLRTRDSDEVAQPVTETELQMASDNLHSLSRGELSVISVLLGKTLAETPEDERVALIKDAEERWLGGIPYDIYMRDLRLSLVVADEMRWGFYRSNDERGEHFKVYNKNDANTLAMTFRSQIFQVTEMFESR